MLHCLGARILWDKKYGQSIRINTKILSVVPNGRGVGTVRIVKTMKRVNNVGITRHHHPMGCHRRLYIP